MAELDEEEDVVFKALVVEAAWVVGASWALGDRKIIGRMTNWLLQHPLILIKVRRNKLASLNATQVLKLYPQSDPVTDRCRAIMVARYLGKFFRKFTWEGGP